MRSVFILLLTIICSSCIDNKSTTKLIDLDLLENHLPSLDNGKKIFNNSCLTCHLYGTGGATMLTDKNAWEQLFREKEMKTIFLNVLNGFTGNKGPMPEKGACYNCTQEDLLDAISYILYINRLTTNNKKFNFNQNK